VRLRCVLELISPSELRINIVKEDTANIGASLRILYLNSLSTMSQMRITVCVTLNASKLFFHC
jgi:hypothetical protein